MITRTEFYAACLLLLIFIGGLFFFPAKDRITEKRVELEVLDSILEVERDSALAVALVKDLKADSLQAVINRRDLDIKLILKKYETKKRDVLVLGADSSVAFFIRASQSH